MSEEHKKYLKKNLILRVMIMILFQYILYICFYEFLILFFILFLWQLLVQLKIIDGFIFSSPKMIIETFIQLHKDGNLYSHIGITIYETIISFSLGTIIGVFVATLLWWNHFLERVIDPYLIILNSLPKVALGPIIIIIGGANINSIIIMALLISVIITIINACDSFKNTNENQIKIMKSFKATKRQIFFKLVFPSSKKSIISTLKINISMSLVGVIMGEFLVSKKGIGYLIMYGSQVFNINLVFTGIIILCIVAALMYYSVLYIEKLLLKKKMK